MCECVGSQCGSVRSMRKGRMVFETQLQAWVSRDAPAHTVLILHYDE